MSLTRTAEPTLLAAAGLALLVAGCIRVDIPNFLDFSSSFILTGTSQVVEGVPGTVWVGENGVTYHLFQSPDLPNTTFDAIVQPGVTSRLEIQVRDDLVLVGQIGTAAEVLTVLE